ncbi:unnamed protein product [Arctia plantaginis]|uniref:Peptidase S1 domain-containing protein n=1 Tax=Arctia plantaginis TaxID=874455 RepID=A0A8S1BGE5_ARCPL|nr:unnamed protein product [Arctia plantaginis]
MITICSINPLSVLSLICYFVGIYAMQITTTVPKKVEHILHNLNGSEIKNFLNNSRRIVVGSEALESRPYMVYLKLPASNAKYADYRQWLCGGVIIHEEYILTSAACIEDARHFYIVSGTYLHDEGADRHNNPCIKNGAKKAIWKCVPRNYVFDGHENDNIRWMNNDIAIVKTEDEFDFTRRIRGCEYIPRPVCYNNQSQKFEEPETVGSIAGWGSTFGYNEPSNAHNMKHQLLEAPAVIISKATCKKRWGKRYHQIIENYMICTKDTVPDLSEICAEKYVDCTDIQYDDSGEERRSMDPETMHVHTANHKSLRKQSNYASGGFCENDHGGPLIYGTGLNSVVIGIISACLVKEGTNKCHGPFLYTSVWKNRVLINCAIFKDPSGGCDKLFRAGGSHTEVEMSWADHPDGPAKNELKKVGKEVNDKDKYESTTAETTKTVEKKEVTKPVDENTKKNEIQKRRLFENSTKSKRKKECQLFNKNSRQIFFVDVRAIEVATTLPPEVTTILSNIGNDTRRIINGQEVTDSMPYMVYLKLPSANAKQQSYRKWLCGGAIIHEEYILTSAACIEDVTHFYVVSGTYKYADEDDRYNNPCIKNGAKKAVWKCVPKNYVFDGHENDNIRWMNNDIAVVKIEDGFDFTRRIRGCDFIPKPVCYNNQSQTLENPGTVVSIAGWGTTSRYNEWINRRKENQHTLLEALVEIIPKNRCKRRWGSRYHNIIDNYMICSKDIGQSMSEICNEKYVDCSDISYDDDEDLRRDTKVKKTERIPTNLVMHSAYHNETSYTRRLRDNIGSGGFCENDHGGPLVYGSGVNSMVIGVISACLVKERTNKCYGPFLYTSVYKNRQFISCAIFKEVEPKCRRQFRSGVTHVEQNLSWKNHPDGPAKNELEPGQKPIPNIYEPTTEGTTVAGPVVRAHDAPVDDKVFAESGFIIRAHNDTKSVHTVNTTKT